MADFLFILSEAAGAAAPGEPKSFGIIDATAWVSIAMALFIGILLWKKVPALVAGMLDNKIAEISKQLKEAEQLRLDAESLKAEYEAKLARAAKEADELRARADAEAEALVAKAKDEATALIARRKQMAEDRIAAAEANALADVRAATAKAATDAAAKLIADKHDAKADKALVDDAIAAVAKG
jgi:F-type H+-transporting ATPase subunit b